MTEVIRRSWLRRRSPQQTIGVLVCIAMILPFLVSANLRSRVHAQLNGWALVPQRFDVGSLPLLTRTQFEFDVTNISGEKVEIVGAKADCSCVITDFGERINVGRRMLRRS